jgi:hypothetical protein
MVEWCRWGAGPRPTRRVNSTRPSTPATTGPTATSKEEPCTKKVVFMTYFIANIQIIQRTNIIGII